MTKVTILGQEPTKKKELKKIEFVQGISIDLEIQNMSREPHEFKFLELICKNYSKGMDLMFVYDDPNKRGQGTLVIGHFNDGVI